MADMHTTGSTGMNRIYGPTRSLTAWGAIFAGSIVALAVQIFFSVLGLGIGISLINPLVEQGFGSISGGAGIWILITTVISLFIGGWFASRLSGAYKSTYGVLQGLVSWGLATLVSFYLMTTAVGSVMSGFVGALGRWVSTTSVGMVSVTPQIATQAMGAIRIASSWAFFTLILSAVGAAIGGYLGTVSKEEAISIGVETEEGEKQAAA